MKALVLLMLLVSCTCNSESEKQKVKLPQAKKVAEIDHRDSYVIYRYSDDDAICYTIYKMEAISISCIPKK